MIQDQIPWVAKVAIRSALVAALTNMNTDCWLYSSINTVILLALQSNLIHKNQCINAWAKNMAGSSVTLLLVVWCFSWLLFPMS